MELKGQQVMRMLLPTRDFCFSLLIFAVCALIGGVTWGQRHQQPLDEQLPGIFLLVAFFWAALYMLGRQIFYGPLFYRYGKQRKFEIPLQSVEAVRIGPLHEMEGSFLLVSMKFESPKDSENEMRSFRLCKPQKNLYDRINGQAQVRGGDLALEGDILDQAEICWDLKTESEDITDGLYYNLDLKVPVKGHDSHYLSISPLKMKKASSAIAGVISEQGLLVEVTLGIGYGIGHFRKRGSPSFEAARVYCESYESV